MHAQEAEMAKRLEHQKHQQRIRALQYTSGALSTRSKHLCNSNFNRSPFILYSIERLIIIQVLRMEIAIPAPMHPIPAPMHPIPLDIIKLVFILNIINHQSNITYFNIAYCVFAV